MSSSRSVTLWIDGLRAGDPEAAQQVWQRYFERLVALARNRLRGVPRRAADEEDVALSAFDSFCRAAEQGRFPCLADRDDLWQVLVVLTARKAFDLATHERRQKRGGGAVRGESAFLARPGSPERERGVDGHPSQEPSPEFAAEFAEECQRLLNRLGDDELRSIAVWKMEGYTEDEIAGKLGCAPRTVRRRLRLIRAIWEEEGTP